MEPGTLTEDTTALVGLRLSSHVATFAPRQTHLGLNLHLQTERPAPMRIRHNVQQLRARVEETRLSNPEPPTRKVFSCIVDETALIAGVSKRTRDGIRKWVNAGAIRLFVPIESKILIAVVGMLLISDKLLRISTD